MRRLAFYLAFALVLIAPRTANACPRVTAHFTTAIAITNPGPNLLSALTWRAWARHVVVQTDVIDRRGREWYFDVSDWERPSGELPQHYTSVWGVAVPEWASGQRFTIRWTISAGGCTWHWTTRQVAE